MHFAPTIAGERLTQVRFPSLPEAVAEKLREAVLAGQLKPGERLLEQKLAAGFGIGQPTLREALKELEFQGFVRKSPKKGTYVTELTTEDFRKIQEVRMALEVVAIERAARNITDDGVRELEKLVSTMRTAVALVVPCSAAVPASRVKRSKEYSEEITSSKSETKR